MTTLPFCQAYKRCWARLTSIHLPLRLAYSAAILSGDAMAISCVGMKLLEASNGSVGGIALACAGMLNSITARATDMNTAQYEMQRLVTDRELGVRNWN